MKLCFECGQLATEEHHVIPRLYGGTKTVPLCPTCHSKVHGIGHTLRVDSTSELTKRALDKKRNWELFATFQALKIHYAESAKEVQQVFTTEFEHEISIGMARRLMKRVQEMDQKYIEVFFSEHIDSDLSYLWNDEHADIRFKKQIEFAIQFAEQYSRGEISKEELNTLMTKFIDGTQSP